MQSSELEIELLCKKVAQHLAAKQRRLITVESCTGGGIAYYLTNIPGSSVWFERSLVTYSNEAKIEMAHVSEQLINHYGAVSQQVAKAMAVGGLRYNNVTDAVSVTGVAGPDGGSEAKPVGTVWFGWARQNQSGAIDLTVQQAMFAGDRHSVRQQSIVYALNGLLS